MQIPSSTDLYLHLRVQTFWHLQMAVYSLDIIYTSVGEVVILYSPKHDSTDFNKSNRS